MAQVDLVRQCFAPRCYKSFFRGLFQGFCVIASREHGGLNFFRTFLKRFRVRTKPAHSEELARRNVLVYMGWVTRPPI